MEFIRFGGNIPGEYWGCCACDIIQNFHQDPDTPASIQLVEGDGGSPLTEKQSFAYLGPTLRDIFWQRLRISTFGKHEQPNKAFLAIMEQSQLSSTYGSKWLGLLKEAGFEFIRCFDNSVYTGPNLGGGLSPHKNYLFGLFRNIGGGKVENPFQPPKQWTDLPHVSPEQWDFNERWGTDLTAFADEQAEAQLRIWNKHGPTKILTEKEVTDAGAPVIVAGLRTLFPPQLKSERDEAMKTFTEENGSYRASDGIQDLYDSYDDEYDCESCCDPDCEICNPMQSN